MTSKHHINDDVASLRCIDVVKTMFFRAVGLLGYRLGSNRKC